MTEEKNRFSTLGVFCGSADHLDRPYYDSARVMGELLAQKGITLVYGGGRTGMMGAVARGVLDSGGEVIGVVPHGLESPQLVFTAAEITHLELVENIQIRKARMNELSEGFIALPGGFGTMDELFEVLTWSQIGLHRKPVGLLNVNGYYDDLIGWIQRSYEDHFIYQEHLDLFVVDPTPEGLLEKLSLHRFPADLSHWLER
jgi:uncharacterized protein (TIGR00730 family)